MIVAHLSAFSRNSHGIASPSVTAFKQVFLSLLTNYSPCRTQLFGIRARKIVRDTVDKKRLYSTIFDQEEMQQPTLYEVLVKQLYTIKAAPVKLALDNMEKLYNLINNPMDQDNLLIVHVAGTNGKGSVCYKIAKTFQLAGYRTGLFTGPHISSFRERIQINSVPISEKEVSDYISYIFSLLKKHQIPASFFEITTALAFSYFNANDVDVVVLETGLGGRLDASNVIKRSSLSIITSIGLEHTKILGDTIELIAKEKAGIIKNESLVLVGPHVPHDVVRKIAQAKQSEYFVSNDILNGEIQNDTNEKCCSSEKTTLVVSTPETPVHDFDVENSRIAQAAFHLLRRTALTKLSMYVSDENIIKGTSIRPPCRFEIFQIKPNLQQNNVTVILDVVHNPPALKLLMHKLKTNFPDKVFRFVVGLSKDKNLMEFGSILVSEGIQNSRGEDGLIHLVEAACNPKAATVDQILVACPALGGGVTYRNTNCDEDCTASVHAQIQLALHLASLRGEVVVICGTVFIMSDARRALNIEEPHDSKYITSAFGIC